MWMPRRCLQKELRPDVHVAIRAYHLKHSVNELGPDVLRDADMFPESTKQWKLTPRPMEEG